MASILIIDDTHLGRTHADLAFRGSSHSVRIVRDGAEALAEFASHPPECVVLKQRTPAVSTEELIERFTRGGSPARVVVRGVAMKESTVRRFTSRGASAVINGPCVDDARELVETVDACIVRAPLSQAG